MKVSISRRYRFSASHRLHSEVLSATENEEVFGKCNNPYGHGHNYDLWVTVRGRVNAQTGLVVVPDLLDTYVTTRVVNRFASRNLNQDIKEFDGLVPTTENLTMVVARILQRDWHSSFGQSGPALARVYIQETARNSFELPVNDSRKGPGSAESLEETLALR